LEAPLKQALESRSTIAATATAVYYRPELDALRFFAFLCVFAFHRLDYVPTDPVRNVWTYRIGTVGAFGVPVFFLLSAFLITELLMRERERTGKVHVLSFYMRRILRIWPLYFAVFFGLALLNHFLPGVGTEDRRAWFAFTFFTGNWYITFHGWIAGAVDPLWSISVEEQFYIVIPVLASFGGRKVLIWACSLLLVASYITVLLYALHHPVEDAGEWTNSFVHFQFFSAGTLIALILRKRSVTLALPFRFAGFAIAAGCWFAAMLGFRVQSWNPQPTPLGAIAGWLLVLAGTILFFLSIFGMPARWIPGWLAYFGRISYGLYLFHSLIFFLIFEKSGHYFLSFVSDAKRHTILWNDSGTVIVLFCSLMLAHLSYRYFEHPFRKLKERFTLVPSRDQQSKCFFQETDH
jgi:peptidoglycan/LPS O-acetylase OafA/YrhL